MRTQLKMLAFGLLALQSANFPIYAQIVDWQSPTEGFWSESGNWDGGVLPGFGNTARIGGSFPGVENTEVVLDQPAFVDTLLVRDGMSLVNRLFSTGDEFPITVVNSVRLTGENPGGATPFYSRLRLYRSPAAFDLNTERIVLNEGSRLELHLGAIANVHDAMVIHGPDSGDGEARVIGSGVINLSGDGSDFFLNGTSLVNSGAIDPVGSMTFNQTGGGLYNLDGNSGDIGRLLIDGFGQSVSGQDHLTFNGTGLTDPFSSQIRLRNGGRLSMNLSEGWTADASSEILFLIDSLSEGAAVVDGGEATLEGVVALQLGSEDFPAIARFEADTTINSTATFQLQRDARLQFVNSKVNGGEFGLGTRGRLTFEGDTVISGGEFSTPTDQLEDGNVQFLGNTTYRGQVTFNGFARQTGNATVQAPTLINAGRFDLQSGGTEWTINSSLTINAENIDVVDGNLFGGTKNVSGIVGRLTINLADPDAVVLMGGELNLANQFPIPQTRVAGSAIHLGTSLNADGAGIRIEADTTFGQTSSNSFATDDTSLVMTGRTRVEAGALFVGDGLLQNDTTGRMTLDDGVSTDDVGVYNAGMLDIDDAIGIAAIDHFENRPTGTLAIDLAGHLLGDEFDHLMVAGTAKLDGTLEVHLILDELGTPLFTPEVGDEFTILTSLAGVAGEFTAVLPTIAAGQAYGWEVFYHPHDVTIRLSSVGAAVPEPASLALLALGLIASVCCRRQH